MIVSKQLDVSYTLPKQEVIDTALAYNLACVLITEAGPAGGNQVYEFTGESQDLNKFLVDQFGF